MDILAIIQARTGSTRLPNKVLRKIKDVPIIQHVFNRISQSKYIQKVVLATTVNPADDLLVKYVQENMNCAIFRGSEENVLERFYLCAKLYQPQLIVRITADDPLKDAQIIDQAIQEMRADPQLDYCSNTIEPTFPEGLDIEVFKYSALETAYLQAQLASEKEHVTPYIWKQPNLFKIKNFKHSENLSSWRWTLDNIKDWQFIEKIYERFYDEDHFFTYQSVISFLKDNPGILKINCDTVRNAGYLKSILEEKGEFKCN